MYPKQAQAQMPFRREPVSLGDFAGDFFDTTEFNSQVATGKLETQCSLEARMNFRIALESWDHTIVSLLPTRTKLAWLCSSCNENHVTEIAPERQEQPGFTPFQPMCIFVRGPVPQTHTPFISLSSPTGAILWVKRRNSHQVSRSPCFPSAESF